jgi:hypothetical protein
MRLRCRTKIQPRGMRRTLGRHEVGGLPSLAAGDALVDQDAMMNCFWYGSRPNAAPPAAYTRQPMSLILLDNAYS